jgi:hypothetical protein
MKYWAPDGLNNIGLFWQFVRYGLQTIFSRIEQLKAKTYKLMQSIKERPSKK